MMEQLLGISGTDRNIACIYRDYINLEISILFSVIFSFLYDLSIIRISYYTVTILILFLVSITYVLILIISYSV